MRRFIDGWYSPSLGNHMEIVSYGHWGFPLLLFPTAAADYLEYERFLLIDALEDQINAGRVRVYSINSINKEAWLNRNQHPYWMGVRQAQYNSYIENEVIPYIWNEMGGRHGVITSGASLGAYHAVNQLLRRPDLFAGCIAMSGCYNLREYFHGDGYGDENIFFNNIDEYLPGLNGGHLHMLRHKEHIHIVTGQGNYENPGASAHLSWLLHCKGIPHELDVWGHDMPHDWPTWRAMLPYFVASRF